MIRVRRVSPHGNESLTSWEIIKIYQISHNATVKVLRDIGFKDIVSRVVHLAETWDKMYHSTFKGVQ